MAKPRQPRPTREALGPLAASSVTGGDAMQQGRAYAARNVREPSYSLLCSSSRGVGVLRARIRWLTSTRVVCQSELTVLGGHEWMGEGGLLSALTLVKNLSLLFLFR